MSCHNHTVRRRNIFFSFILLSVSLISFSQNNHLIHNHPGSVCGISGIDPATGKRISLIDKARSLLSEQKKRNAFMWWLQKVKNQNANGGQVNLRGGGFDKIYEIPVLFHKVFNVHEASARKDNEYFGKQKFDQVINQLNSVFESAGIQFCMATHKEDPKTGEIVSIGNSGFVDDTQEAVLSLDNIATPSPKRPFIKYKRIIQHDWDFNDEIIAEQKSLIDHKHIMNVWIAGNYMLDQMWFPYGYAFLPSFAEDKEQALPGLNPDNWPPSSIELWESITGNAQRDGIVVQSNAFKTLTNTEVTRINEYRQGPDIKLSPLRDYMTDYIKRRGTGETLVHEIGHYLSLFHTFGLGQGCRSQDHGDFIQDTPMHETPSWTDCSNNFRSIAGPPSICQYQTPAISDRKRAEEVIYRNAMSYSSDYCKKNELFTQEQILRMRHTLEHATNRKNLGRKNGKNPFCRPPKYLAREIASLKESTSFFPNPVMRGNPGFLNTEGSFYRNHQNGTYFYKIISSNGKVIIPYQKAHFNSHSSIRIETASLPAGSYFLFLEHSRVGRVLVSKQFVVQ